MFSKRLFIYFFIVFAAFAFFVLFLQYNRENSYKREVLNSNLEIYAEVVENFINQASVHETQDYFLLDSINEIIGREKLRISLIDLDGAILYDSDVDQYQLMENHLNRPEVQQSAIDGTGTDIRTSATTGTPYYYFSRKYDDYYIRTSLDYDPDIRSFLQGERIFLIVIILLFFLMTMLLIFISGKFGKTLSKLKEFALKAANDQDIDPDIKYPKNELGVISQQIVNIYRNLRKSKDEIQLEKEKLFQHLQISREGVAIFSEKKGRIISNSLFIQNINYISDRPSMSPEQVFSIGEFKEVNDFIEDVLSQNKSFSYNHLPKKSFPVKKRGKYFRVNVIVFPDKTFEISVNDVTVEEQEKNLKQQLTSNIAHELRTPVSSIIAYLETLKDHENLDAQKQQHFIERAYKQARRLSGLVVDISVLNKMDEAGIDVDAQDVVILDVVNEILDNFHKEIQSKQISVDIKLDRNVKLSGNYTLIFSIFQNLIENTLNHAGNYVKILLSNSEDENYYYFSYGDTGSGIPEKHLSQVFDRFYRVDKGRSRKMGGTGLGLAIVKNAVNFHKGEIMVKNRDQGGLEFLFSLRKNLGIRRLADVSD